MSLAGRIGAVALLCSVASIAAAAQQAVEESVEPSAATARVAAWRGDLDLLRAELPRRRPDLYHHVEEREFLASLDRLAALVPYVDLDGFRVQLQKVLAAIGEGQTSIDGWPGMFPAAPIGLVLLSDGLFVAAATETDADLVGGRVVRLGQLAVDDALDQLLTVIPADNDVARRSQLANSARLPQLCAELGIGCSRDCLKVAVARKGDTIEREICVAPELTGGIVHAPDPASVELPVSRTHLRGRLYWSSRTDGTLYVRYDACRDDASYPFAQFAADVLEQIDEDDIERLVLDLRANPGGDGAIARPLIDGLVGHATLDRPGGLFVLVGPETLSAAFRNAYELSTRSHALLVGTAMGQRPNYFGDPAPLELPGSGLVVRYATTLHRTIEDADPETLAPDITAEMSSADYFAGRDPAFAAALSFTAPAD